MTLETILRLIAAVLLAINVVLLAIDGWQTRYIALHPASHSEINLILGRHPSVAKVRRYFVVCILLMLGIAWWMLDQGWSLHVIIGACFIAGLELWCIVHNRRSGIPFRYSSSDK